ncbi:hypothetical protein [Bermanella marisrubri]|uniref:GTPase-translation elongation factors n=1 Tax=Bermanella marisrubri TaxID=207949 RepID=Q1N219_9GAMM|nr:hypothetical protein [Bermanella marisrubri]EAT12345.1 GTPase - translation elongation factors [Bermanella marisrubri]
MEGQKSPIRIAVPKIQQSKLSFCDGSLDGFEAWTNSLPMANTGAAAKLLFQASRELNVTRIPPIKRYKMLEIIRNAIYDICEVLNKRILSQSIKLGESDLKVFTLAQTLQNQLAIGYKHIVLDEIAQGPGKETKALTFAIHRAIADLSQTILRAYQLYSPAPANAWLELHQLYGLAEAKRIHEYSVKDNRGKYVSACSITDAYVRTLLLGCAKPNQLRQKELSLLYAATELWTSLVKVSIGSDKQSLFILAQHKDHAPVYRSLIKSLPSGVSRGLNPSNLATALQKHLNKESSGITVPGNLSDALVNHIANAWGAMVQRSFHRTQHSGQAEIAIGLLACHYFCAEEKSFPFLLKSWNMDLPEKKKSSKKASMDVWDQSFDAGGSGFDSDAIEFDSISFISKHGDKEEPDTGPKGTAIVSKILDTSPGGYGIAIDNPPASVQTGELVVIKEPKMLNWSLGCIRWIRSQKDQPTQLGIELIAPKAEAIAARILNKTGENGEFLRGLRIPALPAAGQDATLVLPIMPFKVGSKAEIMDGIQQQKVQLLQRHNTSRSFVQYSYNPLTQLLNKQNQADGGDDEFASIWDKL